MLEMKILSREAIPAALEKALRYRLLNEPELASSICEDVLAIDPENQEALVMLILAVTDRFGTPRPAAPQLARDLLPRLRSPYEREYYAGIIWEREAIARLRSNLPRSGPAAYERFRQAMACYERAEAVRPAGNDDAILRWNSCARLIASHHDVTVPEDTIEVAGNLGE
ncbi:MAG TPA: hypothetical protein VGZ47_16315 [Gemmataceae bacterium]|jgi:hypothetical protein|nr:hypothetical protein [Gemmataceae bacterium]